jgi:hypothetical protein
MDFPSGWIDPSDNPYISMSRIGFRVVGEIFDRCLWLAIFQFSYSRYWFVWWSWYFLLKVILVLLGQNVGCR